MAYEEAVRSLSYEADSSIGIYTGVPGQPGSPSPQGGKQYFFVKITGVRTAGLADDTTSKALVVGVLQNQPQATGAEATVAIRGAVLVKAGTGGLTAGQAVKIAADGRGIAATLPGDLQSVVGVAVTTAAVGYLATVQLKLS
jgi:hypothetical protein